MSGRLPSTARSRGRRYLARVSPARRAHRTATRRLLRGRSPRRPAAIEALARRAGLLDVAGVHGRAAPAAFFAIAWTPDLVAVPAAGAAPPPWRWGPLELVISAAHHVVYAVAGEATYRALAKGA